MRFQLAVLVNCHQQIHSFINCLTLLGYSPENTPDPGTVETESLGFSGPFVTHFCL